MDGINLLTRSENNIHDGRGHSDMLISDNFKFGFVGCFSPKNNAIANRKRSQAAKCSHPLATHCFEIKNGDVTPEITTVIDTRSRDVGQNTPSNGTPYGKILPDCKCEMI